MASFISCFAHSEPHAKEQSWFVFKLWPLNFGRKENHFKNIIQGASHRGKAKVVGMGAVHGALIAAQLCQTKIIDIIHVLVARRFGLGIAISLLRMETLA